MFLGTTFFCGKNAFLPPATNVDLNTLSISDGTYDHLFLSIDTSQTVKNINDDWKYETRLNAPFDKDLEAGNIGFSVRNTDTIVIKTREKGTFEWKTIYTIPITTAEDFSFVINYPYSKNRTENEYMMLSTINGVENSYTTIGCETSFDGFFIVDKDNIYGTVYNTNSTDTVRNTNNTVLSLLNNKYPTVFTNSESDYNTGTTSGCFLKIDVDTGVVDEMNGASYRKNVVDWLCNNKPKILKLQDGRAFLIKVTGTPSDTGQGHEQLREISFDWTEIGDVDNEKDLYLNNLSDVDEKWW